MVLFKTVPRETFVQQSSRGVKNRTVKSDVISPPPPPPPSRIPLCGTTYKKLTVWGNNADGLQKTGSISCHYLPGPIPRQKSGVRQGEWDYRIIRTLCKERQRSANAGGETRAGKTRNQSQSQSAIAFHAERLHWSEK